MELDLVRKRIRTAEISTLPKDDREYIKMSAKVECKPSLNALDVAIFKAECELLYNFQLVHNLNC